MPVKHVNSWIKLWLAFAAALAFGLLLSLWGVHAYREWAIDRRVDQHMPLIRKHAEARGLPVRLVRAVVRAESGGHPRAHSDADARGLMQVTPTALEDVQNRFNLPDGDLFDPDYNLLVGTTYLKYLLDRFDGDAATAVQAYHMGPTAVARDKPPGPQTRAYVQAVLEHAE